MPPPAAPPRAGPSAPSPHSPPATTPVRLRCASVASPDAVDQSRLMTFLIAPSGNDLAKDRHARRARRGLHDSIDDVYVLSQDLPAQLDERVGHRSGSL